MSFASRFCFRFPLEFIAYFLFFARIAVVKPV